LKFPSLKLAAASALLAITAAAGIACADDSEDLDDEITAAPTAAATPRGALDGNDLPLGASLDIVSPNNRSTLKESSVDIEVDVDGFDLVDKQGQPARSREGHLIYYLDVPSVPVTSGVPAVVNDPARFVATTETEHTWQNLSPGQHILAVQLVNNDQTPLTPPVVEVITVTVE
jgi:hypothetical protein